MKKFSALVFSLKKDTQVKSQKDLSLPGEKIDFPDLLGLQKSWEISRKSRDMDECVQDNEMPLKFR